MADFPADNTLRSNDTFDLKNLTPGRAYSLRLSGTFGGATVALSVYNKSVAGYDPVTGGSWTAYTEQEFRPVSSQARFTVTGGTAQSITVDLVPFTS